MKTVIIHGQSHKGSTYHIAHALGEKIGGECREFFLPRDFDKFCVGCNRCFMEGEEKCPHYEDREIHVLQAGCVHLYCGWRGRQIDQQGYGGQFVFLGRRQNIPVRERGCGS